MDTPSSLDTVTPFDKRYPVILPLDFTRPMIPLASALGVGTSSNAAKASSVPNSFLSLFIVTSVIVFAKRICCNKNMLIVFGKKKNICDSIIFFSEEIGCDNMKSIEILF